MSFNFSNDASNKALDNVKVFVTCSFSANTNTTEDNVLFYRH